MSTSANVSRSSSPDQGHTNNHSALPGTLRGRTVQVQPGSNPHLNRTVAEALLIWKGMSIEAKYYFQERFVRWTEEMLQESSPRGSCDAEAELFYKSGLVVCREAEECLGEPFEGLLRLVKKYKENHFAISKLLDYLNANARESLEDLFEREETGTIFLDYLRKGPTHREYLADFCLTNGIFFPSYLLEDKEIELFAGKLFSLSSENAEDIRKQLVRSLTGRLDHMHVVFKALYEQEKDIQMVVEYFVEALRTISYSLSQEYDGSFPDLAKWLNQAMALLRSPRHAYCNLECILRLQVSEFVNSFSEETGYPEHLLEYQFYLTHELWKDSNPEGDFRHFVSTLPKLAAKNLDKFFTDPKYYAKAYKILHGS